MARRHLRAELVSPFLRAYFVVFGRQRFLVEVATDRSTYDVRAREWGHKFRAQMAPRPIKELLKRVNTEKLGEELRVKMRSEVSVQKSLKYAKR